MKRELIDFYDTYYKRMLRRQPQWMFTIYYPEFVGRVLEVGCGTLAPPYDDYVGVDLSPQALRELSKRRITCVLADGETLPFIDNSFDTVCEHEVLSYTSNPDKMLFEMARITKSKIVIVNDNYVLNKNSFHKLSLKDWIKFLGYYLLLGIPRRYNKYWQMSPNLKKIRLPPKGKEAISAVNILFVRDKLTKMDFKLYKFSSFMYDEAGIVKRSFLKKIAIKISPLKYLGPMTYIVAYKKKSTK